MIRKSELARVPAHVGIIPDGNRRWADGRGLPRQAGYDAGIDPGLKLLDLCRSVGIREVSVYGFTKENVRRPSSQVRAFQDACVRFATRAVAGGAALRIVGDHASAAFPSELRRWTSRTRGDLRVNLLANYGWQWDLRELERAREAKRAASRVSKPAIRRSFASHDVPRVELVVRWGGRHRLSGFLPLQCAYADLFVIDTHWPDMRPSEFLDALRWYAHQDVTIGG